MAIYVLDPGESVLFVELCRTVDLLAAIGAELARDGLTVTGSRGQLLRAHPLLSALTAAQATASRLVAELALPMPPEQAAERPQKAAAVTRLSFA
jgi:hypothetical protein